MLKAFLLIFDPAATWEKIADEQRSVGYVSGIFLLPLLLLSVATEGCLLSVFGHAVGPMNSIIPIDLDVILRYGGTVVILTLAIVVGGAFLLTRMGESFHSRHSFQGCFVTLAYSISPLILSHVIDGFPAINTWICYTIGILLSVSLLYRGIPRTLRPEPSNALGMYLFSAVFIIIASGLAHYVSTLVASEQILTHTPGL